MVNINVKEFNFAAFNLMKYSIGFAVKFSTIILEAYSMQVCFLLLSKLFLVAVAMKKIALDL
jgi:hypothetical protein